jgi:hypothetical protein
MDDTSIIEIRELDPEIIPPLSDKINMPDYEGGSKIVVVGKPGTGKSSLIKGLLYCKRHIFPVGMAMSGSEDTNHSFAAVMPSTFIYNEYNEEKIKDFIKRQKLARQHLANPWAFMVIDDCTDDPKIFNKPLQNALFKKGRHWKMMGSSFYENRLRQIGRNCIGTMRPSYHHTTCFVN